MYIFSIGTGNFFFAKKVGFVAYWSKQYLFYITALICHNSVYSSFVSFRLFLFVKKTPSMVSFSSSENKRQTYLNGKFLHVRTGRPGQKGTHILRNLITIIFRCCCCCLPCSSCMQCVVNIFSL